MDYPEFKWECEYEDEKDILTVEDLLTIINHYKLDGCEIRPWYDENNGIASLIFVNEQNKVVLYINIDALTTDNPVVIHKPVYGGFKNKYVINTNEIAYKGNERMVLHGKQNG